MWGNGQEMLTVIDLILYGCEHKRKKDRAKRREQERDGAVKAEEYCERGRETKASSGC